MIFLLYAEKSAGPPSCKVVQMTVTSSRVAYDGGEMTPYLHIAPMQSSEHSLNASDPQRQAVCKIQARAK